MPRGDGLLTHDLDPNGPGPQDACGVFGVWAPGEEVAKLTSFGLSALQHRGQEAAGIAVSDGCAFSQPGPPVVEDRQCPTAMCPRRLARDASSTTWETRPRSL